MFRLVEAKEILERLRQLEDEYEDLPLIHFLLRDTISVFDTLTAGFLLRRAILPDREYESLWVDVMLSGSEQNGGHMIAGFKQMQRQIREIDTEGIGFEGDTLVVEEGIELTEKKETEQGHTLLVDYTTPFGITRCRFLEAGEDRYVCQYPDGSYLPPEMIRMLEERGKKSLTAKSIEHKGDSLGGRRARVPVRRGLQDYPMAPDTTILSQGESYVPINLATAVFERANSTATSLVPFDLNENVSRTLHQKVCEQVGIDSADQLTESTHDKVLATVHDNLTRELAVEWRGTWKLTRHTVHQTKKNS